LLANAAESYEEALTVVNSCGMRWRLVAPPARAARAAARRHAAPARAQLGITSAWTSVSDGGPS
jgi:hypothetical protein